MLSRPRAAVKPGRTRRRVDWRHQVPNALTAVRLVSAPALVALAIGGSSAGFLALLALALATEIDGTVARALGVESEFGRLFDSWADLAVQLAAFAGGPLLWPALIRANLVFYVIFAVALAVPIGYGLVCHRRPLAYHTWLARVVGALAGIGAIQFAIVGSVDVLRAAAVIEVVVAAEYFTIAVFLPGERGTVPSAWHAWRSARAGYRLPLSLG